MAEWETGWSGLERIAALLFSLAGLADLAAGAPAHRRRLALGFLSHGEAEARAFLIGVDAPVPAQALESAGDAVRLAARLRALALLLVALMVHAARPVADAPRAWRAVAMVFGPAARRLDAPALAAPDTS